MGIKIYIVDAFTHMSSGGNPAGVIICDKDLDQERMQEIAREVNLSETAFILPIDEENFRLRFFTPLCEVDLCGHATIASFYSLAKLGYIRGDKNKKTVYQDTKAGRLEVDLHFKNGKIEKVLMEQARPKDMGPIKNLDILADLMGINIGDIGMEDPRIFPEIISTGLKDIILPVRSKSALEKINIKKQGLSKFSQDLNIIGVHAFYYDEISKLAHTRNFAPLVGIDEESATGTSNGALIYYLKKHNILEGDSLVSYQGEKMNRLSEIHSIIEEAGDTFIVRVGGQAQIQNIQEVELMFIEKSLKNYIEATASGDPTPGGGSVAALVGSLGSALTSMVSNLTVGKKAYEELDQEVKDKILANSKEIERLTGELSAIVDEDTKAFDKVMLAFKMAKETEEEKAKRSEAIQDGYRIALEVPLRCGEKCLEVLKLQDIFADYGNVNAITDVGVGTLLAYSGLEGALFNVTINLASIKDQDFKKEISKKVEDLLEEGKSLKEELLKTVYERLG